MLKLRALHNCSDLGNVDLHLKASNLNNFEEFWEYGYPGPFESYSDTHFTASVGKCPSF